MGWGREKRISEHFYRGTVNRTSWFTGYVWAAKSEQKHVWMVGGLYFNCITQIREIKLAATAEFLRDKLCLENNLIFFSSEIQVLLWRGRWGTGRLNSSWRKWEGFHLAEQLKKDDGEKLKQMRKIKKMQEIEVRRNDRGMILETSEKGERPGYRCNADMEPQTNASCYVCISLGNMQLPPLISTSCKHSHILPCVICSLER